MKTLNVVDKRKVGEGCGGGGGGGGGGGKIMFTSLMMRKHSHTYHL